MVKYLIIAILISGAILGALLLSPENREPFEQIFNRKKHVTVMFVGDMMFDRYVRQKNYKTNFENVLSPQLRNVLKASDLLIGNLEGPISTFLPIVGENPQLLFTFNPEISEWLKDTGFDAVSIGNNHIMNFGDEGLEQTKNFLNSSNVGYFGDPLNPENYWAASENGVSLAFVAENEFDSISPEKTAELIKKLDPKFNHVIVYAHWGQEYENEPSKSQKDRAMKYIEAGADLIIGSHPHVIQKNKNTYYSLGNFVFDQYWNEEVRCGLIIQFRITKNEIELIQSFNSYLEKDGTTSLKNCSHIES